MARWFLLIFYSLCLPACAAQSAPSDAGRVEANSSDEDAERNAIFKKVQSAVASSDFASLSAMDEEFRSSRARTPSGVWKLAAFHAGLQSYLAEGLQPSNGCQYSRASFIQRWAAAAPRDPAPIITDAALLLTQAWCIRGDGYANTVAPQAWPRFRKLVAAASQTLADHKDVASLDPEFYAIKLKALRGEGAGKAAIHDTLEEATAREPYYHRTYFSAAWSYLPQWGGSHAELELFAHYAVAKTEAAEQTGLYARIFWSLEECGCDLMTKAADRSILKEAMRDVYDRYPVPWNGRYFASIMCGMGEGEEGRHYLRAMHPEASGEEAFAALFASCDVLNQASS